MMQVVTEELIPHYERAEAIKSLTESTINFYTAEVTLKNFVSEIPHNYQITLDLSRLHEVPEMIIRILRQLEHINLSNNNVSSAIMMLEVLMFNLVPNPAQRQLLYDANPVRNESRQSDGWRG